MKKSSEILFIVVALLLSILIPALAAPDEANAPKATTLSGPTLPEQPISLSSRGLRRWCNV